LSRIWDALKQAEHERSRAGARRDARNVAVDEAERRKGPRHLRSAYLMVYGSHTGGHPFHEDVETIDASDEGCTFELETEVLEGQRLFLVHSRTQAEQECRVARAGKRVKGRARIAVAFASPTPDFWRQ
jgi:PilZ domain